MGCGGKGATVSEEPAVYGRCAVCGDAMRGDESGRLGVCWVCLTWPQPLIDAHLGGDADERERVKVRLIAEGGNHFEFRRCRIEGEWLALDDTRQDATFWVAQRQIITVWEERV